MTTPPDARHAPARADKTEDWDARHAQSRAIEQQPDGSFKAVDKRPARSLNPNEIDAMDKIGIPDDATAAEGHHAPARARDRFKEGPGIRFIVICQSIIGNHETGYSTHYGWDGKRHETRKAAIKAGWKERDSDDFNIGVTRNGRLIDFCWMHKSMDAESLEAARSGLREDGHFA